MINLKSVLMIIAVILLALSGVGVASPRVNLQSLGLACWALAVLVS